jgi:threonine synthase
VVISTAHGLKFTGFKTQYHASQIPDVESSFANPPLEIPAQYEKVRDALFRALDARNAQFARQS